MSVEEAVRLIFSFLGGGLVVAMLNLWHASRLDKIRRQVEFVKAQLGDLYGPLQFFTSCSVRISQISGEIHKAYAVEYEGKTSDAAAERAGKTIDVSNAYVARIEANNKRIADILTNHYALIEPNDAEVFAKFMVDCTRRQTEFEDSGRLKTPLEIYRHLGDVAFLRPEFAEAVDKMFKAKQAELSRLLGLPGALTQRSCWLLRAFRAVTGGRNLR
jgi:hypothetical protein